MHLNLHQFGPRYVPSKIRPTVHSRGRPMSQQGQNSSMAVRFHLFFPTLSQSSFFFSPRNRGPPTFSRLCLYFCGVRKEQPVVLYASCILRCSLSCQTTNRPFTCFTWMRPQIDRYQVIVRTTQRSHRLPWQGQKLQALTLILRVTFYIISSSLIKIFRPLKIRLKI